MSLPSVHSHNRMTVSWLTALFLFLLLGSAVPAFSAARVITWGGNAQEWNRRLGVDGIRLGCSSVPESCIKDADEMARSQGVKTIFLAIVLNAEARSNAALYSRLSLSHPVVQEIGFDDFVSQAERQKLSPAALNSELDDFARQLKSANPNLSFGITLYMDQLSSGDLNALSQQFRQSVGYVHLFPHYRQESDSFSSAVSRVHSIFPNAKVIAGVYAYDRRDYLPCTRSGSQCSNEQELNLFKSSFQERWSMLTEGKITAIEFYPGNFGLEQEWAGWNYPRSCREGRRQECVANTQDMREIVKEITGNKSLSSRKTDH